MSDKQAYQRATVDTTVDAVVSGVVQAGSVALFTAAIPIPGVGTAIGVAAGIALNSFLNVKLGKGKKSAMDKIKGWFR